MPASVHLIERKRYSVFITSDGSADPPLELRYLDEKRMGKVYVVPRARLEEVRARLLPTASRVTASSRSLP